jgi:hypothetical protein
VYLLASSPSPEMDLKKKQTSVLQLIQIGFNRHYQFSGKIDIFDESLKKKSNKNK